MIERYKQMRARRAKGKRREGGFGLIETLVMVAVAGAVVLIFNRLQIARQMDEVDTNAAKHALLIQSAVNKYISDHKQFLVAPSGPGVPGFASPLMPTVAELQATPADNPYLPSGYNIRNQLGMDYSIMLFRLPAGCAPAVNCTDVEGMISSNAPLLDPGSDTVPQQADGRRVGNLANKIGMDAASSKEGSGTVLTGPAGTWAAGTPGGNRPGILVIRAGYGSVAYNGLSHLLPRDGSRPMAGTLNMGGNAIANASTISATSNITTTAGNVTSNTGSLTTNSGNITTGSGSISSNSGSLTTNTGSITTQNGNITTATGKVGGSYFAPGVTAPGTACGDPRAIGAQANGALLVCRGGTWRTGAGPFAEKGDACSQAGELATTWSTNEAVMCRGSTYVSLANQIGKYVEISRRSVVDGDTVPHPTCDAGGTPTFRFGMVQTAVDVSSAPPKQVTNLSAINQIAGSAWVVQYKLRDDMGNQTSASVYNLQAVMYLECKYP